MPRHAGARDQEKQGTVPWPRVRVDHGNIVYGLTWMECPATQVREYRKVARPPSVAAADGETTATGAIDMTDR